MLLSLSFISLCLPPSFLHTLSSQNADNQDSVFGNTGDMKAFAQGETEYICVCEREGEGECV